jgi:DHA1 family tetracycline resistance protein-like MFS transporter
MAARHVARTPEPVHSRDFTPAPAGPATTDPTVPTLDELPEDHPLKNERAKRRALATVAFTLFLDLMGFGIILPILPFYAESMHATETMVALLSTTFSAAQFVMSPVLGRISDRYGRRPVMMVSIAGSAVAALVLGFAHALWLVFLARLVAGSSKANVSTAHAYVADLVPQDQRAKYMGRMGAAMGLGFVFGPGIGGLLGHVFTELPFFVSAALSLLNLAMAAAWLPETHFSQDQAPAKAQGAHAPAPSQTNLEVRAKLFSGQGLRRAVRGLRGTHMAWLVVIAFCFYLSFAGMESTMALFGERVFGWGYGETGLFMTYIGVNMVVFQGVVVGRAVARMGEGATLAIGLLMVAVALILLGGVDHFSRWLGLQVVDPEGHASVSSLAFYAVGGLLLSGGNGLTNATLSALVSRVSSADEQGWNMGIKESASSLARVSGPVVAGPLFQHVDPGAPMIVGGLIALLNFKVALLLRARLKREKLQ